MMGVSLRVGWEMLRWASEFIACDVADSMSEADREFREFQRMKINAWFGFGLAVIAGTLFFTACEDYDHEFDLDECTEDWACRTNFGIGYTCTEDGYCTEPQDSEIDSAKNLRDYCQDSTLNFPPEIFESTSARRSITLGVITDFTGVQLAHAARLAVGLAEIRGGLRLDSSSPLSAYKFTLVACDLTNAQGQNDAVVRELVRFLRNDVRTEAILLGLGEAGTNSAIGEIAAQDAAAGERGHTLVVSANAGAHRIEARMSESDQVWTMATSERNMLRHIGEQLVLRRLQPYAIEACKDSDGNEAEDGTCANPHIESVNDLLLGNDYECPDETPCEELEIGAYQRYLDAHDEGGNEGADKLSKFVIRGLIPVFVGPGSVREDAQRAALKEGVRNVLEYLGVPDFDKELDADGKEKVQYLVEYLEDCGTSCGRRQMQIYILKALGCDGAHLSGDGDVMPECGATEETEVDAVLLLSEALTLTNSTFAALIGTSGEGTAQTIAERVGLGGTDPSDADTVFLMPAVASSSSVGQYSTDWANETHDDATRARWFNYVREGRIFGVRQSADRSREPFQIFLAAQEILGAQKSGTSQHYIAQAYDASWLAMAAIAGSIATIDQDSSTMEADVMRAMRSSDAQTHSQTLRINFSGETRFNLTSQEIVHPEDLKPEMKVMDFIPTRWNEIIRIDADSGETVLGNYPFLDYSHLFTGASGELRFTGYGEDEAKYGGRERMSYDYGVWMPTVQDKVVEEAGDYVDLNERQCTAGMVPTTGYIKAISDAGGDELRFVCPVETAVCRYTKDLEDALDEGAENVMPFCVPVNPVQKMPYAFPVPLITPEASP